MELQHAVFQLKVSSLDSTLQAGAEFLNAKWLGDIITSADARSLNGRINGAVVGKHHHGNVRI